MNTKKEGIVPSPIQDNPYETGKVLFELDPIESQGTSILKIIDSDGVVNIYDETGNVVDIQEDIRHMEEEIESNDYSDVVNDLTRDEAVLSNLNNLCKQLYLLKDN